MKHFLIFLIIFLFFVNILYTKNKNNEIDTKIAQRMILLVIVATLPAVIFGKLFEAQAETIFRSPLLIAGTLFLFGGLLYLVDKWAKTHKKEENLTFWDSLIIGLFQALAIIPGVSRSGATMTASRMRGANRIAAAHFSFLISAPVILGAIVLKLPEFFHASLTWEIFFGIISSAVSGYLAIKYLLKWLESKNYEIFFWYRFVLAIIIVAVFFYR